MPGGQGQIWGRNGEYSDRTAALRKAPPAGLVLPLGFAEIPELECRSPCLQIRSASSVLHSSFCHCFIAPAGDPGVSCLLPPFPSPPTPGASTRLVHGTSELEPSGPLFSTSLTSVSPPALHHCNSIPLAPLTSLLFSLTHGFSVWGPGPMAAASLEFASRAYSWASPRVIA